MSYILHFAFCILRYPYFFSSDVNIIITIVDIQSLNFRHIISVTIQEAFRPQAVATTLQFAPLRNSSPFNSNWLHCLGNTIFGLRANSAAITYHSDVLLAVTLVLWGMSKEMRDLIQRGGGGGRWGRGGSKGLQKLNHIHHRNFWIHDKENKTDFASNLAN